MSDKWIRIQRDEIRQRNQDQRLATMAEAERLRAQRRPGSKR